MGTSFPVFWGLQDASRKFTTVENEDSLNWIRGGMLLVFFLINCCNIVLQVAEEVSYFL